MSFQHSGYVIETNLLGYIQLFVSPRAGYGVSRKRTASISRLTLSPLYIPLASSSHSNDSFSPMCNPHSIKMNVTSTVNEDCESTRSSEHLPQAPVVNVVSIVWVNALKRQEMPGGKTRVERLRHPGNVITIVVMVSIQQTPVKMPHETQGSRMTNGVFTKRRSSGLGSAR